MNQQLPQPAEIDSAVTEDMSELETAGSSTNAIATCPAATIEYGLFFDGTGNNADNHLLGIGMRENGEITSGSYNNDITNVRKLQQVYLKEPIRNDCGGIGVVRNSDYVEGIGTSSGEADQILGMAFGSGSSGIKSRVQEAFDGLKQFIQLQSTSAEIEEVRIDVFGFSRGAAAARHFVNLVNQGYYHITQDGKIYLNRESYQGANEIVPLDKIKVRFLGLFDTVVSTTFDVDDDNYGDLFIGLNSQSAEKIYHITAADEFRKNFCLTSSPGEQFAVPGAHSDIGGGYGENHVESVFVEEFQLTGWDGMVSRLREQAVEEKKREIGARYVQDKWIEFDDIEDAILIRPNGDMLGGYNVFLKRPWIDNRLSRVSLHLMHKKAIDSGVPFSVTLPNNEDYQIPSDLLALKNTLLARAAPDAGMLSKIKRNYVHHSANITPVDANILPAVENFIRPNVAREGNVRVVFDNDSSQAK